MNANTHLALRLATFPEVNAAPASYQYYIRGTATLLTKFKVAKITTETGEVQYEYIAHAWFDTGFSDKNNDSNVKLSDGVVAEFLKLSATDYHNRITNGELHGKKMSKESKTELRRFYQCQFAYLSGIFIAERNPVCVNNSNSNLNVNGEMDKDTSSGGKEQPAIVIVKHVKDTAVINALTANLLIKYNNL